jgi:5-methylcytosine-specific restriction endonuclease McrA
LAALRVGDTSEWRATIVARETACLDPADRRVADAELGPRLADLGDREVEAAARAVAYRLDPRAFVDRSRGAANDRDVSLRPAPDTMSRLSGFLPVAQGVAAYAALSREADRLRSEGDPRGRGQIMADTLVERVTGQATAEGVPVEVQLVLPADTLLAGGDEPAVLVGAGPVPAAVARTMLADPAGTAWLRRIYARPADGSLVAMDSRRRRFPTGLRRLLQVRDRTCRTPWCGAPIRHTDHVIPVADGGATSAANGQGLCEACNYTKQAPGWRARPGPGGAGHRVEITTPTGQHYTSRPPPLSGARTPGDDRSLIEEHFRRLIHAA